eukprot:snap_masked-scaffold_30-processed-gene-1.25-mRNA-1 protein AED:1.00 eAED:1.00 QI:0/-1/0/0/-1/1/1/0/61
MGLKREEKLGLKAQDQEHRPREATWNKQQDNIHPPTNSLDSLEHPSSRKLELSGTLNVQVA